MRLSMKLLGLLLGAAFVAGVGFQYFLAGEETSSESVSFSGIQTAFCPSFECSSLPISALDSAKERILVAMYSFTNEDLRDALIRAHERGIVVRVVVEKQQASGQYSQHEELAAAGILVRIDSNPNYMHHKFAVIDSDLVINGSMNWSGNGVGENNENVMVIHSPELNKEFADEFENVWSESLSFN